MIIYIVGISCVGKTTIGKMLADKIGFTFFDLNEEIEKYYKKPIKRIQDESFVMDEFRDKASVVLDRLFSKSTDTNTVIAGTPAGLKFAYLRVYKKHKAKKDLFSIYIKDSPENILNRLTFYDMDSNPITVEMDPFREILYLKELKADYNYFKSSYQRADLEINIENIPLKDLPDLIVKELQKHKIVETANIQSEQSR
ncbi:MAG: shikimate kinase [Dysgonamonadaceae bacterium]|nr:shikimate kinase [Dysgonamonadaceae bacterium]